MDKIIALDIGGTNSRCALINQNIEIEKVTILPTLSGDKEMFVNSIIKLMRATVTDFSEVKAISMGLPGRILPNGYIDILPNAGIKHLKLGERLEHEFNLPVHAYNDADAAAIAEYTIGNYKDVNSMFFLTISTGIGGSLVYKGKLKNSSYEVGHTLLEYNDSDYETEELLSGRGIVKLCAINDIKIKSSKRFFAKVKRERRKIMPVYQDWLNLLAKFITNIQETFQVDLFTLTGGVIKSADIFLEELRELCPKSRIELCLTKQEAGLLGAAILGFNSLKE